MPGVYNEAYLGELRAVAAAARERGISTIIDFHQDGFSRHASRVPATVSPTGRSRREAGSRSPTTAPAARTGRS